MPKPRAVLFDLDGVLVESKEAWYQLVSFVARELRMPDIERGRFDAGWGQGLAADLRDFFPGAAAEEVDALYHEHLLDFDDGIQIMPDAVDTFIALHKAQVPCAVVTNTPTDLARDILAFAGLIGLVEVTVGASNEVRAKPAPDTIVQASRVLQVDPAEALLVGDSRFDEEAAQAAGAAFVGYRTQTGRSINNLIEVIDLVVSDSLP